MKLNEMVGDVKFNLVEEMMLGLLRTAKWIFTGVESNRAGGFDVAEGTLERWPA
jgi:hypothetical protein